MQPKQLNILSIGVILMFSTSACLNLNLLRKQSSSPITLWEKKDSSPKVVTVLPFENKTSKEGLEILVRKSFYNHFCSKNFHDLELCEVNETLKIVETSLSKNWRELNPSYLGKLFNTDYLIYGEVSSFRKIFLGIYSQITIGVKIKMVETSKGNVVWYKKIVKRSYDGGIPFSIFGIIPAAFRSGLHLRKGRLQDLIDRICRDVVEKMPNPPVHLSLSFVDIQVASFTEKTRATKIFKEFKRKGYNPRIEKVHIEGITWYRILLGPYCKRTEAEKIKKIITMDPRFNPIFIYHRGTANTEG